MATQKKTKKNPEDLDRQAPKELQEKIWNELGHQSELVPNMSQHVSGSESRDYTLEHQPGIIHPFRGVSVDATPDEYMAREYPWLERSQDIPRILKALLREVVAGRFR